MLLMLSFSAIFKYYIIQQTFWHFYFYFFHVFMLAIVVIYSLAILELMLIIKLYMFPTQVKSQCRTRPATTASHGQHRNNFFEDEFQAGYKKYKQNKQKAKALQQQYESLLSNVHSLKKSLQMTRNKTCQHRISFLKTYEAKKLKLKQFELEQQKKLTEQTTSTNKRKASKIMKLNMELQSMVLRSDMEKSREKARLKNKTEKEVRKTLIMTNKNCDEMEGRRKYEQIRESHANLREKKQYIADLVSLRARHNYLLKAQHQKHLIQSYDNILKNVEEFDDTLTGPYSTVDDSQSFLITTKKGGF